VTLAGLLALAFVSNTARAADPAPSPVPAYDESAIARRGFFYIGGGYVGEPGKQLMHEQMYVEVLTPRHPRSRYPLVLIHGAAQTATNWMGTPDGRPGWADYFVGQGYTVYMVDQPARGRSPWLPDVDGKLATFTAEQIESRFTARKPPICGRRPKCIRNGRAPAASATPPSTPSTRRRCRI
jgi:pimeloyl-ACP methyl ester carboxylesterase